MGDKIEQDDYEDDYQVQQIEAKIELTPKLIKGLESIGYIAAGKNHSIAIRTYKVHEKELKMYSWGCGWHGQTGHGDYANSYSPSLIKVPAMKDTKFMIAACGAKHTIGLDIKG